MSRGLNLILPGGGKALCVAVWCVAALAVAQKQEGVAVADPVLTRTGTDPFASAGLAPAVAQAGYQVVYDVEDPCFEFLGGDWTLSKTGSYTGSFYYEKSGPGDGSGRGRWVVEGLPSGTYTIEFFADNGDYSAAAQYQVIHAGGVSNLQINMNNIPAGWTTLGSFQCNGTCVVNISDAWTGAGTKISVDALRFTLTTPLPAPPVSAIKPHIGVCIDDAGQVNPLTPSNPIYSMIRLPFPLTIAVMPLQSYTTQTANEVYSHGCEVILHQPMAAISVPNPGSGGITDSMTLSQVRSTVAANLDAMPHVVGMNNHMGSLITQQTDKMTVCVEELKSRGLYFYDSRTITTSVAFDVAMSLGVLTAERDLFIDDSSVELVKARIRRLALCALHAPEVPQLAIGHVRADTATGLAQMAAELDAMGVEVWPISRCIGQVIEVDRMPAGAAFASTGAWASSSDVAYSKLLHDGNTLLLLDPAAMRSDQAVFTPSLQSEGVYDIFAIWPADPLNSSEIRARIKAANGIQTVAIDQAAGNGTWKHLGRFPCKTGLDAVVTIDDVPATTAGKKFRADAVRFDRVTTDLPALVEGWLLY